MSDDEGISIYDEVEIEDMTFDEAMGVYQFPCPCGDKFQITLEDLLDEQDIAVCPSCSLMIRVIFDLLISPRTIYQNLPLQAPLADRSPSLPEPTGNHDRNMIQIATTM
ncbi:diphthamide biosynthesis protein 3 [Fusarium graminearum PH-1]|uniref:diphthamide biosynthesis protein 3 n=1 Tax=Gibberella zeae (strain ATCC MYA-4620 / CBS 123657 / FGSC 9075 / NRRL 31084 / PH-1) TaxID=229533 RepID=UPI000023E48F|nr:diphthamide biosynthesis protein 3 [Fusarium graminearum PH-1]ESU12054.1 diphthamide biosynthesis protein 3 [Fusarium graminearum PH-1]|eukprot:XP_011324630.1 diphthamide biosynthesis protein 3 [Fusarium graminearum PH-1]